MGYPSERGADEWRRYDYDYFQSELVAAEGIHLGEWKIPPSTRWVRFLGVGGVIADYWSV